MTRRYLEQNEMKIQLQILWDAAKAVLTGKFIALNGCIRKKKSFKSMTSTLTLRNRKGRTNEIQVS